MKLSLYDKIGLIVTNSHNNPNFLNRFFKRLGIIVFLFQALEEKMRTFFLELLEYEDKEEVYNLILAETSFMALSNKLLNLFKARYPNKKDFEKLIDNIQKFEVDRNKYIHSMYYIFSDKIYRTKPRKRKNMSKIEMEENMNLKSFDILINGLFNVIDELEVYRQMKIMNEMDNT